MKYLIAILLIINPLTDLDKIARVNKAKKEAEKAYLAENYELAKEKYLYLRDSMGVNDEKLLLNLANTQFLMNDSTSAQTAYSSLKESTNTEISSLAYQQLGAMQFKNKKYEEALKQYKSALKANPANSEARYNYELLKKLIKEQEEQEQQQNQDKQNQDQENKDQEKQDQENKEQNQENKDQQDQEQKEDQQKQEEQDQKDQKENQEKQKEQEEQKPEDQEKKEKEEQSNPNPIDEEKLKEMKITEEKAMLILEAMKNNEIQYIQQNKRKAKKKKDPTKPDW
jgi:hypothetical protein